MDVSEHVVFVKEFEEMQDIVCHLSVLPSAPPKINIRTKSAKKASFDIIYSEAIQAVELKLLAFVCSSSYPHALTNFSDTPSFP